MRGFWKQSVDFSFNLICSTLSYCGFQVLCMLQLTLGDPGLLAGTIFLGERFSGESLFQTRKSTSALEVIFRPKISHRPNWPETCFHGNGTLAGARTLFFLPIILQGATCPSSSHDVVCCLRDGEAFFSCVQI